MSNYRLLTAPGHNPKLAKNKAMGYLTAGLAAGTGERVRHQRLPRPHQGLRRRLPAVLVGAWPDEHHARSPDRQDPALAGGA